MSLHWLMLPLAFGWVSATDNCSYKGLIEHLGLDSDNFQMKSLRPVYNWSTPTDVYLDLFVTSITDVDEKAQSFSTQVTIVFGWINEFTVWNPSDFCGIFTCTIEKDMIWIPDINIAESIKTEFASMEDPYVKMLHLGLVVVAQTFVLTTACKMDLHRFPFDVQTCTLTLQSPMHSIEELKINQYSDASFLTQNSKKAFQTQGEWELLNIDVSKANSSTLVSLQDQLVFKITMKRRPLLYIITFIFPVFCFLVLDVASFFMDSRGGEKLSFKVTLLLAISVLLLILKDTLPSTASDIPLIGVYCCMIFTLIGISILEIVLVNFLMAKGDQNSSAASAESTSAVTDNVKNLNLPSDSVADRNEDQLHTADFQKKIIMESRTAANQNQNQWTTAAIIIDVIFMILYTLIIIVFLTVLCKAWFTD